MGDSSNKTTVGYRYSWDIHAGLGRGPVNEIVSIVADKKRVFVGTAQELSKNTSIYINKPNLFGGEDAGGEGGIRGYLDILMGEKDQVPSSRLKNLLKGTVPGFRGIVTTLFSGMISAYSASPKPWAYRIRRTTKGWDNNAYWYTQKCTILLRDDVSDVGSFTDEAALRYQMPTKPIRETNKDGDPIISDAKWKKIIEDYNAEVLRIETLRADYCKALEDNVRNIYAMNPAHILIECATNRDWGRGLTFDEIDLESFQYAADYLYNEGFGLCFRYNRQDSLDTFVQQILDHIGAAQYADLSTGKLKLKLIRDDYHVDELPLFTYDNGILSVQDDDSIGIDAAPNEIVVKFKNPVLNKEAEVRAQNLGSIQAVGLISTSNEYKAIPTYELAARVAQRVLEMNSAGMTKLTMVFDRRGSLLMPADCFRVSLPERGIDSMVMRVGKIDENENGSIRITAVQDVFGMPETVYSSGNQPSEWLAPDTSVYAVNNVKLIELPYYLLGELFSAADLDYLPEITGYLGVLASSPSSLSINYEMQTRPKGSEFKVRKTGDWSAYTQLTQPLDKLDTCLDFNDDFVAHVGDALIINNEILRIDEIDNNTNKIIVARGCADTLPASHNVGSFAWLLNNTIESDFIKYVQSEKVDVRLLTQTKDGKLDEKIAPIEEISMIGRQIRPYLPGRISINNVLYPDAIILSEEYVVRFNHRNRLLQADKLIDCLASSISLEAGTQYVIEINKEQGGNVWRTQTTQTLIKLPYLSTNGANLAIHYLIIYSVRDGIESLYQFKAELPVGRYSGGANE